MTIRDGLFSSESVSEGHPDKLADRISDAVLDEFLRLDPNARVACETLLADQFVVIAGEFKTRDPAVFEDVRKRATALARSVIRDSGYTDALTGIDPDRCEFHVRFNHQTADIAQGVDRADGVIGAGDQGLMFGYACDETPELMPAPIIYAHRLVQRQAELRKSGELPWLRPDAKSQVTFRYEDGRPVAIEAVVLSTQHAEGIDAETLRREVSRRIIDSVIPHPLRGAGYRELINPTGRFVTGGPKGDTGLTGRKIIVDTYGGAAPHGGGAFSGKDPSKVDRSAAYMARFLAKQVVAKGWAPRCLVQLAYAIGVAEPVSFLVDAQGASAARNEEITATLKEAFDLTPVGIIRQLNLQAPVYFPTAAYGHFGRNDVSFTWEQTTALQPPDDGLAAAYRATDYCVFGARPFTLRVGQPAAAHATWLSAMGHRSAAVVTAWNPFSKPLSLDANRLRQGDLVESVNGVGLRWIEAEGRDPTGRWQPEESLCIFDASPSLLNDWLVRFEQYAVVHAEPGAECRLVWHPAIGRSF